MGVIEIIVSYNSLIYAYCSGEASSLCYRGSAAVQSRSAVNQDQAQATCK